jgi:protein-disulfide isomerase
MPAIGPTEQGKEIIVAQSRKQRPTRGGGSNLKPFYIALGVVAAAGVAWIAFSLSGGGGSAVTAPIDLAGMEDAQQLVSSARGVAAGPADAPLQILVFSDFTCPACQRFSTTVEPMVKRDYVDAGLVRLTYYDFPLGGNAQHRHGFVAARAARCAEEQGRFWEYHDVLFGRQGEWSFARSAPTDQLAQYATYVGLDQGSFDECLNSDRHAELVTANKLLGDQLGVGATPTIFIGQRAFPQWSDYEAMKQAIERELPPNARSRAFGPAGDTALSDTAAAPGA